MRIGDACSYNDIDVRIADDGEAVISGTIRGNDISTRLPTTYTNWERSYNGEALEIVQDNNRWQILKLPAPTAVPTTAPPRAGDCRENMQLSVGDDCTYPGTGERFTVNADGSGSLGFITSGQSITMHNTSINGQLINFEASRQAEGTWLVTLVG